MRRKHCERTKNENEACIDKKKRVEISVPSVRGGIQGSIVYGKLSINEQTPRMPA